MHPIRSQCAVSVEGACGIKTLVFELAVIRTAENNVYAWTGDDNISFGKDHVPVDGVDGLCILTEWAEFRALDLEKAKDMMKDQVIFDGRNLLDQEDVENAGFTYFAIGKPTNGLVEQEGRPIYAILGNGKPKK